MGIDHGLANDPRDDSLVPSRKRVRNIRLVTFSNILGLHRIFIAQLTTARLLQASCLQEIMALRWGILGAGKICHDFVVGLKRFQRPNTRWWL